jgi:hypothetical protein
MPCLITYQRLDSVCDVAGQGDHGLSSFSQFFSQKIVDFSQVPSSKQKRVAMLNVRFGHAPFSTHKPEQQLKGDRNEYKADIEQAQLRIQVYDQRRRAKLRQARDWF